MVVSHKSLIHDCKQRRIHQEFEAQKDYPHVASAKDSPLLEHEYHHNES
ncbi:protein of unknown function [Vibrio tapetis subsp. tapetis]|uniref:Uncharacterized protein n=1 Tax=Vibrio tapetis subsp. tapetis TaxID=1671868 RepID=A0A2N8ZN79_9VIBR|nr:protein of unknown function [Vibrio tapetis subsp. tapetis]